MGWPKCNATLENETIQEIDLWNGGITFHELCIVLGAVFGLIAVAVSGFLIMMHATHYSKPIEQRHIIRILLMVPVYSTVAFLSVYIYKKEVYFSVLGDCYEAFTIAAFFALLCHYIAPDLHSQKDYFRGIKPKDWVWPMHWFQKCTGGKDGKLRTPRSGLTWFNVVWVGVFQYCVLRVLMTIIAVLTQHFKVYCVESLNPAFSHVWIMVIECIAVTIAMYCLIQFYIQIKDDIAEHRPFLKIVSIKLVIFLSFWQSTVISFLFSSGAIKATKTIASQDLKVGLPNLLICIEMAIFSVLHLFAFSWKPYITGASTVEVTDFYGNGKSAYQGGPLGVMGLLDALNPLDLFKAIGRSFRWLFVGRKRRTMDPSYHYPPEAIGLDPAATAPGTTNSTAYQGAGETMSDGGKKSGRYGSPDEEGDVLLSHAQPNPGGDAHHGDPWGLGSSPYDDDRAGRYYTHNSSSMLEPAATVPRSYSPYDDLNNPYLVPSDAGSDPQHSPDPYHHHNREPGPITTGNHYPSNSLQEQIPIPMPESYQPPPLHDDEHRGRR